MTLGPALANGSTLPASAVLIALIYAPAMAAQTPVDGQFTTILRFAALDERAMFSIPLSRDVVLVIHRAMDARGTHMGWDLAAVDRRLSSGTNFFYECLCGHGPRPHDYYAWHFADSYYPHERLLPVYGYPLEVRVRCPGCEVAGAGASATFARGTIEIELRRLKMPNRRQLRLSDVR